MITIIIAAYVIMTVAVVYAIWKSFASERKKLRTNLAARKFLSLHKGHNLGNWMTEMVNDNIEDAAQGVADGFKGMLKYGVLWPWYLLSDLFKKAGRRLSEVNKSMSTDHLMTFDVDKMREEGDR
jgi:hypothetical protein